MKEKKKKGLSTDNSVWSEEMKNFHKDYSCI